MSRPIDIFVELPGGALEFLPEASPISYEERDVTEIIDVHPFVGEAISFGIETPEQLDRYMAARRKFSKDEAFAYAAYKCVPRALRPYEDGDTIQFIRFDPSQNKMTNHFPTQIRYWEMRKKGESHSMAEILATRSFPGIKTDALFNEGRFSGESGRIDVEQRWLRAQAEASGVSTNGKYYMRGLADFPGDPTAWVSDRGDVLRVAREKNMTVHGYVEHEGHEVEPAADVKIADDMVEGEVDEILAGNPFLEREAVRDEVFAVRTGGVDPNDLLVGDYDESYLQPEV